MTDRYRGKVLDAITEIEVNMQKLRESVDKGKYQVDSAQFIVHTQKSLQKLATYLFKLPNEDLVKKVKEEAKEKKKNKKVPHTRHG